MDSVGKGLVSGGGEQKRETKEMGHIYSLLWASSGDSFAITGSVGCHTNAIYLHTSVRRGLHSGSSARNRACATGLLLFDLAQALDAVHNFPSALSGPAGPSVLALLARWRPVLVILLALVAHPGDGS